MEIYTLLNGLDFAVMASYLLIVIGIGAWVSFHKKQKENLFLAQRSLGSTSIGLTMWGTNVGPSMLIASCATAYSTGIVSANYSWLACIFIFLLAFIFAPYYLQTKVSTLPEFIGKRFDQRTRELLAWYTVLTILASWLAIPLYSGGIIVMQIMNWPLWLSVLALVAISAFFTLAGGLKAVAHTNVFQMSLLIIASFTLIIFGINKAGGVSAVYNGVPDGFWNLFRGEGSSNPWYAFVLGYPVLGIWFWCTDQSMVQSVLGARSLKHSRYGTALTGYLKVLDMPLFVLPGILCLIIFPNLSNENEAYMTMVSELLPHGLIGLIMTVLIAALVSTIASALNSLSTVFTLDIYQKRFQPDASTSQTIKIGRMVTLIGSFLSIFLAVGMDQIKGFDLFNLFQAILGFLAPPLSALFTVGVLWRRANSNGAVAVLTVGTLISLGIGFCVFMGWPHDDFWPHFLVLSFFIYVGLCALMVLVTQWTKNEDDLSPLPTIIETYRESGPVGTGVWVAWGGLFFIMICLYVFFN